jgi:hypothetical protein
MKSGMLLVGLSLVVVVINFTPNQRGFKDDLKPHRVAGHRIYGKSDRPDSDSRSLPVSKTITQRVTVPPVERSFTSQEKLFAVFLFMLVVAVGGIVLVVISGHGGSCPRTRQDPQVVEAKDRNPTAV